MPSVFSCIPPGSRYGNVPNELIHRAGLPFLDNHYRGYQLLMATCVHMSMLFNQEIDKPHHLKRIHSVVNCTVGLYQAQASSRCAVLTTDSKFNSVV